MIYCAKCGKALNDGDMFCSGCGAPVDVETKVERVGYEPPSKREARLAEERKPAETEGFHIDEMRWDLDGYPDEQRRKTDTAQMNWSSVVDPRDRHRYEVRKEDDFNKESVFFRQEEKPKPAESKVIERDITEEELVSIIEADSPKPEPKRPGATSRMKKEKKETHSNRKTGTDDGFSYGSIFGSDDVAVVPDAPAVPTGRNTFVLEKVDISDAIDDLSMGDSYENKYKTGEFGFQPEFKKEKYTDPDVYTEADFFDDDDDEDDYREKTRYEELFDDDDDIRPEEGSLKNRLLSGMSGIFGKIERFARFDRDDDYYEDRDDRDDRFDRDDRYDSDDRDNRHEMDDAYRTDDEYEAVRVKSDQDQSAFRTGATQVFQRGYMDEDEGVTIKKASPSDPAPKAKGVTRTTAVDDWAKDIREASRLESYVAPPAKPAEGKEKFYTFNQKSAEFKALLDEEYERLKKRIQAESEEPKYSRPMPTRRSDEEREEELRKMIEAEEKANAPAVEEKVVEEAAPVVEEVTGETVAEETVPVAEEVAAEETAPVIEETAVEIPVEEIVPVAEEAAAEPVVEGVAEEAEEELAQEEATEPIIIEPEPEVMSPPETDVIEVELPAEEMPIAETEAPAEEMPVAEAEVPAEEMPVAETEAPTEEAPVAEEASTEETPLAESEPTVEVKEEMPERGFVRFDEPNEEIKTETPSDPDKELSDFERRLSELESQVEGIGIDTSDYQKGSAPEESQEIDFHVEPEESDEPDNSVPQYTFAKAIATPEDHKESGGNIRYKDIFTNHEYDYDDYNKSGRGKRIILDIILVALLVCVIIVGILVFAKDSAVGKRLGSIFGLNQSETTQEDGTETTETNQEETGTETPTPTVSAITEAINSQMGRNKNIEEIVEDTALKFTDDKEYNMLGVEFASEFTDADWYTTGDGTTVKYTSELVGTVIEYYSLLEDRYNNGSDGVLELVDDYSDYYYGVASVEPEEGVTYKYNKLQIGEIRRDGDEFFMLTRLAETVSNQNDPVITTQIIHFDTSDNKVLINDVSNVY